MQIESIIAIIIAIVLILEIIGYYLFYIKIKKHNDEIYNILGNDEERKKMKEFMHNIALKVNQRYMDGKIKRVYMDDYYPLLTDEEKQLLDYLGKKALEKFLKSSYTS
ncbi:MAG: hypothetical protein A3K77_07005 [Euryarchaeota archaeon RBG_13_31_8]|nr:MAG: hypothetical protein A3K77_07005 [Euryarchaeota archaeon RBG_13_31_8]